MSTPASETHEFVVAPELAELAERLGVPLHAGDRVRFQVINGGATPATPRRKGGRSAGILAGTVPDDAIKQWAQALDTDKAERRAAYAADTRPA